MSNNNETTQVSEVDVNIDEILAMPGAESVMTPNEVPAKEEKKPGFFSRDAVDTTFIDNPEASSQDDESDEPENKEPQATKKAPTDTRFLNPDSDENLEAQDLDDKNRGGRPNAMVAAAKKLIEEGILTPFEGEENLDNYKTEDFVDLYKANLEEMNRKSHEANAQYFFESLPPEMQYAYEYIANGGTDMKGMFQALAQTRETFELDISKESGQKAAIRQYLQATNYGTPEEIEDEIYSLEDRGELAKKAKQFKPKLDAMSAQIVQQKVAQQEQQHRQRQAQSQKYIENVYNTLNKGELNGTQIDNKIQNLLYEGLIQSNYPSISGKQTNMLGHLLEKYQWVEPRHDLIAEALWLLADPDGYKSTLADRATKQTTVETVRKLKTEQSSMRSGQVQETEDTGFSRQQRSGIPRQKKNFFKR